jgi:hypothetical protein
MVYVGAESSVEARLGSHEAEASAAGMRYGEQARKSGFGRPGSLDI